MANQLFTSTKQAITIVISRPEHGLEIISMCKNQWTENREFTFFPDAVGREVSDFPLVGVTVGCKWQGHFFLANAHKEKWIISDTQTAEVDLEYFSPEWRGCSATLCRM